MDLRYIDKHGQFVGTFERAPCAAFAYLGYVVVFSNGGGVKVTRMDSGSPVHFADFATVHQAISAICAEVVRVRHLGDDRSSER